MADQESRRQEGRQDTNRETESTGSSRGQDISHSSREREDGGTAGFTGGGGEVHQRVEFGGRPNVTEERTKDAIPADEQDKLD